MPVARGPQINARSAVVVGMAGVVVALLLGAGVIWPAGSGSNVKFQVGDTDFDAGAAGRIAAEIVDNGPLLYSDVGDATSSSTTSVTTPRSVGIGSRPGPPISPAAASSGETRREGFSS